ncbi:MAG: metallophosphoesterase [Alphaproteobacteria bacterium]|nr:metallophosphoesterase [Alphaproteobacteria bacterium]
MRNFTFIAIFLGIALPAQAQTEISAQAWVQAVAGGGYEARNITADQTCPVLNSDKGDVAMTVRAPENGAFPLTCAAPVPAGAASASINGKAVPLPVPMPNRILVVGDTGCRIKGGALQACNDPAAWPFPMLAAAAAQLKPDLVVHVGDYLYREEPCPPGNKGCEGSPSGDNWPSWNADFFAPAAPLLTAAPWVILRGNHEDCQRAGLGFLRLLGSDAFDPAAACNPHLAPLLVPLGGLTLAAMDNADAPDTSINDKLVPLYEKEFQDLAAVPAPVWYVGHRPIWAAISGPLNIPIGGNATIIAAASKTPLPPNIALMLSGHIHTFEAINYDGAVPPQIVAGNGGDNLDITPANLKGAIFQGSSGVSVKDGLSVGGFGFLMMTRRDTDWAIDLYDSAGRRKGQCVFMPGSDGTVGRVDCPDFKP